VGQERLMMGHGHPDVVELDAQYCWATAADRGKGHRLCSERTVNSRGTVVARRPPHGVIDPDRRRDIGASQAKLEM